MERLRTDDSINPPPKPEYIQPGLNLAVKRTTGSHAILLTWSLSQLPAADFRYTLYFRSSSSPDKDWKHVKNAVDITSQEFLWPGSPCVGVVCQFRVFGKMATGRTTSGEFILRAFTSDVSSMATSTGHLLKKYFIASPPIPQSTASNMAAPASEATSIRIPAESSRSVSAPDLASSVQEKLISSYELSSDVVTLDAYVFEASSNGVLFTVVQPPTPSATWHKISPIFGGHGWPLIMTALVALAMTLTLIALLAYWLVKKLLRIRKKRKSQTFYGIKYFVPNSVESNDATPHSRRDSIENILMHISYSEECLERRTKRETPL